MILSIAIVIDWAIAMTQARWVQRSLFPYAVVLQCIPVLALVPLIGFWFGYDYSARVIACVVVALFPMVSNTFFGLQSVQPSHREMFRMQKASRATTLIKLELPTALPAILAGMRISAGQSIVGAVVADFFLPPRASGTRRTHQQLPIPRPNTTTLRRHRAGMRGGCHCVLVVRLALTTPRRGMDPHPLAR